MALSASVFKGVSCHISRRWILRSVIINIGGPQVNTIPTQQRAFTYPSPRWYSVGKDVQRAEQEEQHVLNEISDTYTLQSDQKADEAPQSDQSIDTPLYSPQSQELVPWYLQVEPQMPAQENFISARQRIPDLPENPPAILNALLERISVELGMDDLSLLDLRGIDPPPALGANLFMIIGTARSEKHLHFSADKLCRWLRSEHNLSPHADGLLGRQELKLIMRRRAKRSRLLSAVGSKSTTNAALEEGIRTGWICVNLGKVKGGDIPKSQEQIEKEKDVVGFGTTTSGSHVVVQLLTEEKRGEVDFEKLWMAVLKKSRREKEALFEDAGSADSLLSSTPEILEAPVEQGSVHSSSHK